MSGAYIPSDATIPDYAPPMMADMDRASKYFQAIGVKLSQIDDCAAFTTLSNKGIRLIDLGAGTGMLTQFAIQHNERRCTENKPRISQITCIESAIDMLTILNRALVLTFEQLQQPDILVLMYNGMSTQFKQDAEWYDANKESITEHPTDEDSMQIAARFSDITARCFLCGTLKSSTYLNDSLTSVDRLEYNARLDLLDNLFVTKYHMLIGELLGTHVYGESMVRYYNEMRQFLHSFTDADEPDKPKRFMIPEATYVRIAMYNILPNLLPVNTFLGEETFCKLEHNAWYTTSEFNHFPFYKIINTESFTKSSIANAYYNVETDSWTPLMETTVKVRSSPTLRTIWVNEWGAVLAEDKTAEDIKIEHVLSDIQKLNRTNAYIQWGFLVLFYKSDIEQTFVLELKDRGLKDFKLKCPAFFTEGKSVSFKGLDITKCLNEDEIRCLKALDNMNSSKNTTKSLCYEQWTQDQMQQHPPSAYTEEWEKMKPFFTKNLQYVIQHLYSDNSDPNCYFDVKFMPLHMLFSAESDSVSQQKCGAMDIQEQPVCLDVKGQINYLNCSDLLTCLDDPSMLYLAQVTRRSVQLRAYTVENPAPQQNGPPKDKLELRTWFIARVKAYIDNKDPDEGFIPVQPVPVSVPDMTPECLELQTNGFVHYKGRTGLSYACFGDYDLCLLRSVSNVIVGCLLDYCVEHWSTLRQSEHTYDNTGDLNGIKYMNLGGCSSKKYQFDSDAVVFTLADCCSRDPWLDEAMKVDAFGVEDPNLIKVDSSLTWACNRPLKKTEGQSISAEKELCVSKRLDIALGRHIKLLTQKGSTYGPDTGYAAPEEFVLPRRMQDLFQTSFNPESTQCAAFVSELKSYFEIALGNKQTKCVLLDAGVMFNLPGAMQQVAHEDNSSIGKHKAVNVFIALEDVNKLNNGGTSMLNSNNQFDEIKLAIGEVLVFDFHIKHYGNANNTAFARPMLYLTYGAYIDSGGLKELEELHQLVTQNRKTTKMHSNLYNKINQELQALDVTCPELGQLTKQPGITKENEGRVTTAHEALDYYCKNWSALQEDANNNLSRWSQQATQWLPEICSIKVTKADVLNTVCNLTVRYGVMCACINMANATRPGGGWMQGKVSEEEEMCRRTNILFHMPAQCANPQIVEIVEYSPVIRNHICGLGPSCYDSKHPDDEPHQENHNTDRVLLSPAICFCRGPHHNYKFMGKDDIFPFYELRSAAVQMKGKQPGDGDLQMNVTPIKEDVQVSKQENGDNDREMRRRIKAQIRTLFDAGVECAVLSAFGCGNYGQNASTVATMYQSLLFHELKEELHSSKLKHIEFAITGATEFDAFKSILTRDKVWTNKANEAPASNPASAPAPAPAPKPAPAPAPKPAPAPAPEAEAPAEKEAPKANSNKRRKKRLSMFY